MEDRDCRRSWAGEEFWLWRSKVMLDGCREWRGVLGEDMVVVVLLLSSGLGGRCFVDSRKLTCFCCRGDLMRRDVKCDLGWLSWDYEVRIRISE
jgi:hypothetical protein